MIKVPTPLTFGDGGPDYIVSSSLFRCVCRRSACPHWVVVDMKAAVACVSALALPLPTHTFVTTPAVPPRSPTVRHIITRHASSRRPLRSPVMTTHALNLSTAVGTGDAMPAARMKQKEPAVPALDRSNLGLHLTIGSKVMNL